MHKEQRSREKYMASVKRQFDELQVRMQRLRGKNLVDPEQCSSESSLEAVFKGGVIAIT